MLNSLKKDLKKLADPGKAKILQGFFKTGKGEYGEGDVFLGLTSQQIKDVAKNYWDKLELADLQKLLESKIHEERMAALRVLVCKYERANKDGKCSRDPSTSLADARFARDDRKNIFDFYIKNAKRVNSWDLVDVTCHEIVGNYLLTRMNTNGMRIGTRHSARRANILYKLAKSKNLWERRIAIVSTYAFIKNNQFEDTIKISEILLQDKHDLIHKAVGWMLREVGKRDEKVLEDFLEENIGKIPRTALRYAIERFDEKKRKYFLDKKIDGEGGE